MSLLRRFIQDLLAVFTAPATPAPRHGWHAPSAPFPSHGSPLPCPDESAPAVTYPAPRCPRD